MDQPLRHKGREKWMLQTNVDRQNLREALAWWQQGDLIVVYTCLVIVVGSPLCTHYSSILYTYHDAALSYLWECYKYAEMLHQQIYICYKFTAKDLREIQGLQWSTVVYRDFQSLLRFIIPAHFHHTSSVIMVKGPWVLIPPDLAYRRSRS